MSLVATPSPVSYFLSLYPASLHCLYLLLPFVIVSGSPPLYLRSLTFFHYIRPPAPFPASTFPYLLALLPPPPPPLPWLYLPLPFVIASVPRPSPPVALSSLTFCHCISPPPLPSRGSIFPYLLSLHQSPAPSLVFYSLLPFVIVVLISISHLVKLARPLLYFSGLKSFVAVDPLSLISI